MTEIIVVTTTTCPKCPAFSDEIHNIDSSQYDKVRFINETHSDFMSVCKKYDLTVAPIALVFKEGELVGKYDTVEELKENL